MISWNFGEVKIAQQDAEAAQTTLNETDLDSPATGSEHQASLDEKVAKITHAVSDIAQILGFLHEGIDDADSAFREIDDKNKADIEASARYHASSQKKPT